MTAATPRLLLAIDRGAATTSVAILGRPATTWRVLGTLAAPAAVEPGTLASTIATRIVAADAGLATSLGLRPDAVDDLPRLEARSRPPSTLAIVAGSRRTADLLASSAARTPWRSRIASPETHDPREMTELVLDAGVSAILLGSGDPAGPDERAALDDLAALVTAAARRRPGLDVVVAGAIRTRRALGGLREREGAGRLVEVPAARRRGGWDDPIRDALASLIADPSDARTAMPLALGSLAEVTDRRMSLVEVGYDGGLLAWAVPPPASAPAGAAAAVRSVHSAAGELVAPQTIPEDVDAVMAWTIGEHDRHRLTDRLRELRGAPWADLSGPGVRLRLAAARAAILRLRRVAVGLEPDEPADIVLVAGGAFAAGPPAATALAVIDTTRRPGTVALAWDAARLLAPLGTIADPVERRTLVADLADDLLVPLGSAIVAATAGATRDAGSPGRHPVGRLQVDGPDGGTILDLVPGDLSIVDLPPGRVAAATIVTDEGIGLVRRARRATVTVNGGVAGLVVDLRPVPLRLPDRRDRRRSTIAAWDAITWPEEVP